MKKQDKSMGNFPNLRFPGFEGEWEINRFQEVVKINQGLQIPISDRLVSPRDDAYFYITNEFLKDNSEKKYFIKNPPLSVLCNKEDILMTRTGNTGKVVTGVEGAFHNNFFKVSYPKNIIKGFLYNFLKLPSIQNQISKLAGTSTIPDLNHSDFYRIKFSYPELEEQKKIAEFVSFLDSRIQTQKKIIEGLSLQKISIIKKLFENKIKFKTDIKTQNWERKKLAEISEEHLNKNPNNKYNEVFSVAKHKGVINQIEHLGRSFSAKEILHYKLVHPGDLVYTKSPTSDFPFGIIKQNRTGRIGVVSPLYCVFTPKTYALGYLLHEYFNSAVNTFNYLNPLVQKGAKNTMNINNETFLNGASILLPMNEVEQEKIYKFLLSIDKKINLENELLTQYENQKKYLLQNLFV
ncbi:restriction endonuclease subunit S [Chryseobacterium aquaticum]|uniref:Type I restriction modification DNA specificity domain-containing protein n=1 Tax=Chryseobacterium aquaticum subsp. greenlandense TaxID=345663 RepID=A0A101CIH7_9FLAO|nr:restriction endonuclease subunit S [Chryseobacterium aquaticum]KUJ56847.1 hypothetical protein AR686_09880 [Chryseobacterium aquaticum subsp. greenlandense]